MTLSSDTVLREGFTTGSAAAAAARAALDLLLGGAAPTSVLVALPPFQSLTDATRPDQLSGLRRLSIPIAACRLAKTRTGLACATAVVIKDGGDDPDSTHGMRLEMTAVLAPFNASDLPDAPDQSEPPGSSSLASEAALAEQAASWLDLGQNVKLRTGRGIGVVTLPGLPVRPGEPAVNPEPRKQIALAAREAAREAGYYGTIHLLLRAPEGEERAGRTLNARLGILGGISILGTRGIVRPYSHEAWQTTISQGFDIAAAMGLTRVALSTGRRSEQALQRLHPAWPEQAFILAADFARFSINEAARRGFREIVWGCYPGKLLKLAQGLENTHARSEPADLGLIRELTGTLLGQQSGPPDDIPTAQGIFDWLEELDERKGKAPGVSLAERLAALLADPALANLRAWAAAGQTGEQAAAQAITLCLFRPDNTILYKSGPDE